MTNVESILKSEDITLQTKVCLVKAMVFPVVMYGCESCTIKKLKCNHALGQRVRITDSNGQFFALGEVVEDIEKFRKLMSK